MAVTPISTRLGGVTLPTSPHFYMDVQSFDAVENQQVEDTTFYGAQVYGRYTGSGLPAMNGIVRGYANKGAGGSPGFGLVATSLGDTGASMTLTVDNPGTPVTLIFLGIARSVRISHSRVRGGVPAEIDFVNGGDVTTAWV